MMSEQVSDFRFGHRKCLFWSEEKQWKRPFLTLKTGPTGTCYSTFFLITDLTPDLKIIGYPDILGIPDISVKPKDRDTPNTWSNIQSLVPEPNTPGVQFYFSLSHLNPPDNAGWAPKLESVVLLQNFYSHILTQDQGGDWCKGDCVWREGQCQKKEEREVSCGQHQAQSCAECPQVTWKWFLHLTSWLRVMVNSGVMENVAGRMANACIWVSTAVTTMWRTRQPILWWQPSQQKPAGNTMDLRAR